MTNFKINQKVTTHFGNTGTIIGFDNDPKNKPVIVKLDDPKRSIKGTVITRGYYHFNQIK